MCMCMCMLSELMCIILPHGFCRSFAFFLPHGRSLSILENIMDLEIILLLLLLYTRYVVPLYGCNLCVCVFFYYALSACLSSMLSAFLSKLHNETMCFNIEQEFQLKKIQFNDPEGHRNYVTVFQEMIVNKLKLIDSHLSSNKVGSTQL